LTEATEKHKGRAQLTAGERSIGISATVTASDKARLKELGNGNLSAGIRVAVQVCSPRAVTVTGTEAESRN
jgi:hypothetical protein